MATLIGIDVTPAAVRAVVLRAGLRTAELVACREVAYADAEGLSAALHEAAGPEAQHGVQVAVGFPGASAFVHRLMLPKAAARRVEEVLPYELEALLPVELDALTFGHRLLPVGGQVVVLAAGARTTLIRERLDAVRSALGVEAERVGCGALPLANLVGVAPALGKTGPVLLANLEPEGLDLLVLDGREPWFARTLRLPPSVQPAELVGPLRHTLAAWAAQERPPVGEVFLVGDAGPGGGNGDDGALAATLSEALGLPVARLGRAEFSGLTGAIEGDLGPYAKALGLALSLRGRPLDVDLRCGEVSLQRGYGFLKAKAPVLLGLVAAVAISFAFSTWADFRALSEEHQVLQQQLGVVAGQVLGAPVEEPAVAEAMLLKKTTLAELDPMPQKDAFDVLLVLSDAIPPSIVHDMPEFEFKEGSVKLQGIVDSAEEAQSIAEALKERDCLREVRTGRISQVVGTERERYSLELSVECAGEGKGGKGRSTGGK